MAEEKVSNSTQEAIARAEEIAAKAEQQIELDRKKMMDEAKSEITRLVVATTGKVLSKELSSKSKIATRDRQVHNWLNPVIDRVAA